MQEFHNYVDRFVRCFNGGYQEKRYENRSFLAVDWPTEMTVAGQVLTCTLTDSEQQSWDKYGMRPWNGHGPQIAIRDQTGKMILVYRSRTTAPSWSLWEEFTPVQDYDLGYVKRQKHSDVIDADLQMEIEHAFLAATKYVSVHTETPIADGVESIWNVGATYKAKKAQLDSDAAEREIYNGLTWQEQHDEL